MKTTSRTMTAAKARKRARGEKRGFTIWDLPNLAVKTGKRNLARDIDRVVYGK